ncbi:flagellar basal body-associated FliL family protein [Alteromonas sp. S015]|uniref:flagellar basal body-associated FliL family protein n=1 Tax=Alteromonas sp. S015 TaxID=3117401 RepID=UPI002FE0EF3C
MKKSTLLIIIGIAVALLAGGGFYYYSTPKNVITPVKEEPKVFPSFLPLKRFVISLQGKHSSRYLVMEVSLMTHNQAGLERLQQASPLMQNVLVKHFSNLTVEQAKQKVADLELLQQQLMENFNDVLTQHSFGQNVQQVIITNVFVQ